MARWIVRNVLPGVVISFLLVAALISAAELYFHATRPFLSPHWPGQFNPQYGLTFSPGQTLRWTNQLDFWTETKVNSLGFLDREPRIADDACRVAFIGDSFLEAAQVPIDQKVQTVFESMVPNTATAAFGYTGAGQASELPFYDHFARNFRPHVVVLVFFSNDFTNNHAVLEAIRSGWHPKHSPRHAIARGESGLPEVLPPSTDWQTHLLFNPPSRRDVVTRIHEMLIVRSYSYVALYTWFALASPRVARFLDGQPDLVDVTSARLAALRTDPDFASILAGWRYPSDWDINQMVFADHYPAAFAEAVAFTEYALDQFAERSRRDGFRLVVLAPSVTWQIPGGPQPPGVAETNPLRGSRVMEIIRSLTAQRDIPLIDQLAYINSIGGDPEQAKFLHDGHWSPQGHRWAAEALARHFSDSQPCP